MRREPCLHRCHETARLSEAHPALRASKVVWPAYFTAEQFIVAVDQGTDEQYRVLPVTQALDGRRC